MTQEKKKEYYLKNKERIMAYQKQYYIQSNM